MHLQVFVLFLRVYIFIDFIFSSIHFYLLFFVCLSFLFISSSLFLFLSLLIYLSVFIIIFSFLFTFTFISTHELFLIFNFEDSLRIKWKGYAFSFHLATVFLRVNLSYNKKKQITLASSTMSSLMILLNIFISVSY